MDSIILVIDGIDVVDRLASDLERLGYAVSKAALLLREDDSQQSLAGDEASSGPRAMDDPLFSYTVWGLLDSNAGRTSIPPRELVSTVHSLGDQWHVQRRMGYSKVVFLGTSGALHR